MRAGWKTTEFWTTLGTNIIGILVVLGILGPDQASELGDAVQLLAGALLSGLSAFGYAQSRGTAKQNEV